MGPGMLATSSGCGEHNLNYVLQVVSPSTKRRRRTKRRKLDLGWLRAIVEWRTYTMAYRCDWMGVLCTLNAVSEQFIILYIFVLHLNGLARSSLLDSTLTLVSFWQTVNVYLARSEQSAPGTFQVYKTRRNIAFTSEAKSRNAVHQRDPECFACC